jgi:hypothetical protein
MEVFNLSALMLLTALLLRRSETAAPALKLKIMSEVDKRVSRGKHILLLIQYLNY